MVDPRVHPRAFFRNLGKQPKLMAGARRLALQPRYGKRRLLRSPFDNVTRDGLKSVRNFSQERTALPARCAAVGLECIGRELYGTVDFLGRSGNEPRLQLLTGGWVMRIQRISRTCTLAKANQRAP